MIVNTDENFVIETFDFNSFFILSMAFLSLMVVHFYNCIQELLSSFPEIICFNSP